MLPSLLITFREVLEASLIVATILGILSKIGQKKEIRTVWLATACAGTLSIALLLAGSMMGIKIQELYTGITEQLIEGILMTISAIFITWAVFFLHNYFGRYKTILLSTLKEKVELQEQRGLFILVFTAVFREGFEIVLFLSTIYFSSNPTQILGGFAIGAGAALLLCFGLFTATIRMPIYFAFKMTSGLLILFAAGLLAHGVHEFTEAGVIFLTPNVYFPFLPEKTTLIGSMIQSIFGVTRKMEMLSLASHVSYSAVMAWWIFIRKSPNKTTEAS